MATNNVINVGGVDYILNPIEESMKTTIESHTTTLSQRAKIQSFGSGTIGAKTTVDVAINPYFGLIMCRISKGYVEVYRSWAAMGTNGWAYQINLLLQHDYLGDGDSGGFTFTFWNDSGQERLKIESNHSSDCSYWVQCIAL